MYTTLCEMVFHGQVPIRNAAVSAIQAVQLTGGWAVHMLSHILNLTFQQGHHVQALRAIITLFSRSPDGTVLCIMQDASENIAV